jgi:ferrochelatase
VSALSLPVLQAGDARRVAVVLVNVGTPDDPSVPAVRRYLREFLSDPRVIDISALGRFLLLNLVILPFRPKKSAAAYRTVWSSEGSPLLVHTRALAEALRARLPDTRVVIGMRYGNPSLKSALASVADADHVVLVPLYPQYASASTGSAVAEAFRLLSARPYVPAVHVVGPFFDDDGFLDSVTSTIREVTDGRKIDHILFSYHGLPVHQVQATTATDHLCSGDASTDCCAQLTSKNAACYRAQCIATTNALVARLQPPSFSTSFQSRLGRARWLLPNTEHEIVALAQASCARRSSPTASRPSRRSACARASCSARTAAKSWCSCPASTPIRGGRTPWRPSCGAPSPSR